MTVFQLSLYKHLMEKNTMYAKLNDKKVQLINCIMIVVAMAVVVTFTFADLAPAAEQQKAFASGEDAVSAFMNAMREDNKQELLEMFGNDANELVSSGDDVADRQRRLMFVNAYEEQHKLDVEGDKLILIVGKNDWPFPIPLVNQAGQWVFDTASGKEEILNRRIGRNELDTIQVMLAIVDAEREYAMTDRDGDGLLEYAQKFKSDPGKKNGLYWDSNEGEEPSPLGAFAAMARKEGYSGKKTSEEPRPYHGYFYRILTAQGPNAAGGAFDYMVNGKMIGGFAVVAYPADYGSSGIMTFIVNHDGVVYQKDIGENTEKEALAMKVFDPDKTWAKVPVKDCNELQK